MLRGSPTLHGGSLWLETRPGRTLPIIWPHGYQARFDPVELLDEHGEVVAREGDTLSVRGGLRSPSHSDDHLEHVIPGLENAFVVQGRNSIKGSAHREELGVKGTRPRRCDTTLSFMCRAPEILEKLLNGR